MSGLAAERIYERLLVVRCQTGEESALAELIGRYSPRVRFYLRKMAGEAVADDLLQEVWVEVFAKVARLREPEAFGAWIYRIARDKAYREVTRRRRRPANVAVDEEVMGETQEEEWSAEDVERVRAGLDELADEQREVLVLRFVEDMGYEEIAAVVGVPVGTVRSRIHYAKRALRTLMERGMIAKDGTL